MHNPTITTAYYSSPAIRGDNENLISISISPPKWLKVDRYLPLAPEYELVWAYKEGEIDKLGYEETFRRQLEKLNPRSVYNELAGNTLLCYEKLGGFCHRHIVEGWFREHGLKREERGTKRLQVAVAGSRGFNGYGLAKRTLLNVLYHYRTFDIISGHVVGAGRLGERFAEEYSVDYKVFMPEWDKYGKSAGIIRNEEMANLADILIAFWDGESAGTRHMIKCTGKLDKPIYVYNYKNGHIQNNPI